MYMLNYELRICLLIAFPSPYFHVLWLRPEFILLAFALERQAELFSSFSRKTPNLKCYEISWKSKYRLQLDISFFSLAYIFFYNLQGPETSNAT